MAKIEYPTKVSNNGQTIQGKFFSADANEIKRVVNLNAVWLGELQQQVDNFNLFVKPPIPVDTDGGLVIDWVNDLVPADPFERTYFQRYGNVFNSMTGVQQLDNGTETGYIPEFIITRTDGEITSVSISLLFIGSFQIL